jgi:hypothetical protein
MADSGKPTTGEGAKISDTKRGVVTMEPVKAKPVEVPTRH